MLDFGKMIFSTSCLLRRKTDQILHSLGISGSLAGFIKYIYDHKEVSAHDIEVSFGLTKATVSENLNSLENSGYIIRESSKTDGRIKIVKLTAKGEELRKNMKKLIEANEDKITSILSVEEKEMLDKTLKKIREKMEEE